jgi:AcrR family transcriptional regulator
MPRISAGSIREHVSRQREQILAAATTLFRQRGFGDTDLADIARAIGLARNSLYRYFPDKEHILLACVQRDMDPLMRRFEQLEQEIRDPRARIDAWMDLSLSFATGPAHATLQLISEIRESAPDLREEIMKIHQVPNRVLEDALRAVLGRQRREPAVVAAMIAAMTQSAAGLALRRGEVAPLRRELTGSVRRLLDY